MNTYLTLKKNQKEKFIIEQDTFITLLGLGDFNSEIELEIKKNGVKAEITGVVFGVKNKECTLKTTSIHTKGNTFSRVFIKSVLFDNSVFNYSGMIKINKNANLTDAYLKNENLLIGQDAKVNSSPMLEILSDEVKASHGVSISTFDAEQLYYLQSRGLSVIESRNLLVRGFLNDALTRITDNAAILSLSKNIERFTNGR
jgi:Fe-S cluster assembly protein SufD